MPYEEIARSGGGIASSARAFAAASDDAILAQARALTAEMLAAGTTAYESKTGYGLSVDAEARAVRLGRELGADRVTGLFAHAVPEGYDRDAWMDYVDALAASCDVDALDIYVESVAFSNENLAHLGAIAAREGVPLRAHVEQFNANRSVPVALAAGARSVDHLACLHPDEVAPLAAAECAAVLLPGAEFLGAERVAPGREAGRRGRHLRAGHRSATRARRRSPRCRSSSASPCPATAGACARRCWRARSTRRGCSTCPTSSGRWRSASAPTSSSSTPPSRTSPTASGATRCAWSSVAGEVAYVRPDAAWRISS